jgi:hypothetical protein
MTFVNSILEVLQIASLYKLIFFIRCKSEVHLILYLINSLSDKLIV